jgi:RNA polymerase sigma factor (sigma-70 family)
MKRFSGEGGSCSVMNEPLTLRSIPVPAELAPFEGFFEAEFTHLCEALYLLTGDPFEAEEVAQEAMTRVLERWERIRSMDSPTGYAYRTAMNLNRNRIRRITVRARRVFDSEPSQDHSSTVGDQQDVRRALAKISAREREALVLVDWLQMNADEAGKVLGIKASSVRVRLHRARANLRELLGGHHE